MDTNDAPIPAPRRKVVRGLLLSAAVVAIALPAESQIISATGSYDNFDCFNDTGQEAEGFEIDVEDIGPGDVTRIFPDNFSPGQPYIRYGTPDKAALQSVTFPDGHSGIRIVYAAKYVNGAWKADWGSSTMPGSATPIGNGTPYIAKPKYTAGDSCWTLGLGTNYPASGCDHFGISLRAGAVPGKITYHWLVPDPAQPGVLKASANEAGLPPSPVLAPSPVAPGAPPLVHAVAEAPENEGILLQGLFGNAYWVKTFTSFSRVQADLDKLQKNYVPMQKGNGVKVRITWTLLQRAPAGEPGEKAEIEDEVIDKGNVQVTKRYEYYRYAGSYDPENHEAQCGGDGGCSKPVTGLNGVNEKGQFLGAHMNAYDVQ